MGGKIIPKEAAQVRSFSLDSPERLKADVKDEAQVVKEQIEQAYRKGFEEGQREAFQKLQSELSSLQSIIKELSEQKTEVLKQTEAELVELAFKIAEKIVDINLERDKSLVLQILRKAIHEVKDKSEITVYISPDDEAVILENKDKILEGIEGNVRFVVDSFIPKGGCIVQTASGRIDALISSQLDEIKKRIGAK